MRHHRDSGREMAGCAAHVVQEHTASYRSQRERVAEARRRLETVLAGPHRPGAARTAGRALSQALQEASAAAVECLRVGSRVCATSGGTAVRAPDPAAVARCTAQLVELGLVRTWLTQALRDDPGADVATTVQVGSRAATGPHVAGLEAEPRDFVAARLHEPRIGVALQQVVDRMPVRARG